ncbi:MAG: Zn-dependent hydrolase [Alphaproteobacteria bacterium]|nr:Zn-dependent hydrolase [Alphaproteobacteria bacterium]
MPAIKPDRVLADLYKLRSFGTYKTGVHRPTFSAEDIASRNWFAEQCTAAGLETTIDGIGNILGKSKARGAKALSGSHLETQNHAGWLDGALGCIYALEASRAIHEAGGDTGVDVAVFCDEEGHFGSFLGSKSFTGLLSEADIDKAKNKHDGTPLRDALKATPWAGRPRLTIEPERYKAFFEAHIEQGGTLETEKLRIGVVTAIVAIWQYGITVTGEQNHAGTTSMRERRDAGLALVRLLSAIDKRFPEICGPRTVWTTGRITLDPGSHSIIPGRAESLFQLRDADPVVLDRLHAELFALIEAANRDSRCKLEGYVISQSTPAKMDERLMRCLDTAAERHAPGKHVRMPSGAGHDAQWLARKLPAAMMFVPSINGISHHWAENTSDEDLVLGAQVFTDGIAEALKG